MRTTRSKVYGWRPATGLILLFFYVCTAKITKIAVNKLKILTFVSDKSHLDTFLIKFKTSSTYYNHYHDFQQNNGAQ